jgi:CubicO group peptidase (beta-lactamase class C family)
MIFPVLLRALARESVADIGMDAKVRHIVTAYLAPEAVAKAGGLAVTVYTEGHTQFFNYGFADGSTKRPITSDTLFNVASVRKPFEAILVALGTLRGELSLDDPVSRYVPELGGDYIQKRIRPDSCCRPITRHGRTIRLRCSNSWTCSTHGRRNQASSRGSSASIHMRGMCCCSSRSNVVTADLSVSLSRTVS